MSSSNRSSNLDSSNNDFSALAGDDATYNKILKTSQLEAAAAKARRDAEQADQDKLLQDILDETAKAEAKRLKEIADSESDLARALILSASDYHTSLAVKDRLFREEFERANKLAEAAALAEQQRQATIQAEFNRLAKERNELFSAGLKLLQELAPYEKPEQVIKRYDDFTDLNADKTSDAATINEQMRVLVKQKLPQIIEDKIVARQAKQKASSEAAALATQQEAIRQQAILEQQKQMAAEKAKADEQAKAQAAKEKAEAAAREKAEKIAAERATKYPSFSDRYMVNQSTRRSIFSSISLESPRASARHMSDDDNSPKKANDPRSPRSFNQ